MSQIIILHMYLGYVRWEFCPIFVSSYVSRKKNENQRLSLMHIPTWLPIPISLLINFVCFPQRWSYNFQGIPNSKKNFIWSFLNNSEIVDVYLKFSSSLRYLQKSISNYRGSTVQSFSSGVLYKFKNIKNIKSNSFDNNICKNCKHG